MKSREDSASVWVPLKTAPETGFGGQSLTCELMSGSTSNGQAKGDMEGEEGMITPQEKGIMSGSLLWPTGA